MALKLKTYSISNAILAIVLMSFTLTACLPSAATEDEVSQDHATEIGTKEDASESVSSIQQESNQLPFVLEAVDETETGYILIGKFHSVDLPEGASRFVSVSRDGSQVVYFKAISDTINGMYISNIDGSNRQLVAQRDGVTEGDIYDPIFSPDGNWLAMTIIDQVQTDEISHETRVALIHPGTCQIIPTLFTQEVSAWIP